MPRGLTDIATKPLKGDVVEFDELAICPDDKEPFMATVMLRVIAVAEDLVWFKEYGKGRRNIVSIDEWGKRLMAGSEMKFINVPE